MATEHDPTDIYIIKPFHRDAMTPFQRKNALAQHHRLTGDFLLLLLAQVCRVREAALVGVSGTAKRTGDRRHENRRATQRKHVERMGLEPAVIAPLAHLTRERGAVFDGLVLGHQLLVVDLVLLINTTT